MVLSLVRSKAKDVATETGTGRSSSRSKNAEPNLLSAIGNQAVQRSLWATAPRFIQRKCACGASLPTGPMCEECQHKTLQTKLAIGAVDDPLEREADRIADQMMSAERATAADAPAQVQPPLAAGHGPVAMQSAPPSVERALMGSGQPLEPERRRDMERRFGHDFTAVRVHADSAANASARDIGAQAYTAGADIVFAAGSYVPGTQDGQRLIAHELAHVVQQASCPSDELPEGAPLRREPDESEPEPARTDDVEPIYDDVLHFWNLRSGMGEPANEEEEKILENEDISARLVEDACAQGSPTVPVGDTGAPAAPGLSDPSMLFWSGSELEEDASIFELYDTSEDKVQLAKAYAYRVVLQLIHTRPATFSGDEDFWSFHKDVTGYACSEEQTVEQIGEDFLQHTWAFPETWAKRVQQNFIPDFQFWALESFRSSSYARLREAMDPIAPFLAENGLPLGFQASLYLSSLRDAELIQILHSGAGSATLLDAFFKTEEEALTSDLELAFAQRWLNHGNDTVSAIATAQKSVDYGSFMQYGRSPSAGFLMSNRNKTNEFAAGHLRLDLLAQDISYMAYVAASIRRWQQKRMIDGLLDKQFDLADYLIAALDGEDRLGRAQHWRSVKGFDPDARSFLVDSLDFLDIAEQVGKDALTSYVIGAVGGPWAALGKEVFDFVHGLWESHEKISEARDAARDAKSVVKLQQASANLALIMASETLSIGLTLAQVPGLLKQVKHLRRGLGKGAHAVDQTLPRTKAPDLQTPTSSKHLAPTDVKSTAKSWEPPTQNPFVPDESPKMLHAEGLPPARSSGLSELSQGERAFLDSTAKPNSSLETPELELELSIAHDLPTGRSLPPGGEFAEEIVVGNGHTWKRRSDGGGSTVWCRFSDGPVCLVFTGGRKQTGMAPAAPETTPAAPEIKLPDAAPPAVGNAFKEASWRGQITANKQRIGELDKTIEELEKNLERAKEKASRYRKESRREQEAGRQEQADSRKKQADSREAEAEKLRQKINEAGTERARLQLKNEKLADDIDRLKTGFPAGIGPPPGKPHGGAHGKMEAWGGERNHIPPDSVSNLPWSKGPAIWMETQDHAACLSTGSGTKSIDHRAKQAELIQQGKLDEAVQMDIDDIRAKFGDKYDKGIKEMQAYLKTIDPAEFIKK
jgi:hypothetical protein